MTSLMRRMTLTTGLGLLLALASSSEAHARVPRFLRSADRPMSFMLGWGPTFEFINDSPDGFKFTQDMMFHFNRSASGPALGFTLQESFLDYDITGFQTGAKFEYDIQVVKGLAVYVTPGVSVGYHGFFGEDATGDNWSEHALYIQPGVTGKVIFQNRWMVWLSPVIHDFIVGGPWDDFAVRWDVRMGGGVIF